MLVIEVFDMSGFPQFLRELLLGKAQNTDLLSIHPVSYFPSAPYGLFFL